MFSLDLDAIHAAAFAHPGVGPWETVRALVAELRRLHAAADRDMEFTQLLIRANGSKARRIEQLRADLKRMARATSVAGAQSMARHALTQDVARRRRCTEQELKMLPTAPAREASP